MAYHDAAPTIEHVERFCALVLYLPCFLLSGVDFQVAIYEVAPRVETVKRLDAMVLCIP